MKPNFAFFAIGIAFIAIGLSTNSAFYAVGIAFLVIGLVSVVRARSDDPRS